MKGGHANVGPRPDPNALRRERDVGDWTELPAAGRDGDPPEWPLISWVPRELELWHIEWSRPQAIMWERNRQQVEVALYVRTLALAEIPAAGSLAAKTLIRQQMEALGLSVPGMLRNRWKIAAPVTAVDDTTVNTRPSTRERFTVVAESAG